MSKTSTQQENELSEPITPSVQENLPDAAASVNKIRDIIFGSQIKSYEARFLRLEENLIRETAELKDTMRKRFESIESFFKSESEALTARLRAESEERASLISNLERDMKEAQNSLAKRLNDIDAAMRDGDSALRKELMTESRKLLEEISQQHGSTRSLMEMRIAELRAQKTDRALMSDLLREMASQLDNDEPPPSE
ncbi:hypothetical protein [Edaphobacter flagellatus]|uniref:hypothetical protein n=1 Tax=Edaphobacter flagellatus TaxID=1933044 RepID=UPI0021B25759|nr:hypothetical protein [Edaphobacter flagellatus]